MTLAMDSELTPADKTPVTLANIPPELVVQIARHLSTPRALALARTSQHFNSIVTDFAYKRHVRHSGRGSSPLWWAVAHRDAGLGRRALLAGADPNECVDVGVDREREVVLPLCLAVDEDDVAMAEILLEHGADPSAAGTTGSPLAIAARKSHIGCARLLLLGATAQGGCRRIRDEAAGAGVPWLVNARDAQGQTALHAAARGGHEEMCRLLLSHGARLEARDRLGQTPLNVAVRERRLGVVVAFLAAGADPLLVYLDTRARIGVDQQICNSLDDAASLRHEQGARFDAGLAIVEAIVSNLRRRSTARERLPVDEQQAHRLLTSSCFEVARILLRGSLLVDSRDSDGITPLIVVASQNLYVTGNMDKATRIRDLITAGANVNARDRQGITALMHAARLGSTEAVDMLLSAGASLTVVDSAGRPVLSHAAAGNITIVEALLLGLHVSTCEGAASPDHKLRSLTDGPCSGRAGDRYCPAVTKQLNMVSGRKQATSLMIAIQFNRPIIAEVFVANGADVNATDDAGRNTLCIAACANEAVIARRLIEYGVDVEDNSEGGWTALMFAAESRSPDVAKLLIEHGANVHARKDTDTPFSLAVRTGSTQIVEYLMGAGVDVSAQLELDPDLMSKCFTGRKKEMVQLLTGT